METISTSTNATKQFLTGLKAELDPIFRDMRSKTVNQLAANNQLESSVTANRLSQIESDIESRYITQASQFGIADIDRAMRNRISLFGTGLNTLSAATGEAGAEGARKNQFNLTNYENEVAASIYGKEDKGGLMGGLKGGAGGLLLGASLAAIPGIGLPAAIGLTALGGIGGAFAGATSKRSTGRNLLTAGGSGLSLARFRPGSTAGVGETFRKPLGVSAGLAN